MQAARLPWFFCLFSGLAVTCGDPPGEGDGGEETETDTDSETDDGTSTASSTASSGRPTTSASTAGESGGSDPCLGVGCGGKGHCVADDDKPVCLCNDGTFDDSDLDCEDAGAEGTTAATDGGTGETNGEGSGSGGDLPDGEPCAENRECASGYCYPKLEGFPFPMPGEPVCHAACIGGFAMGVTCNDDGDCCQGTCEMGFGGNFDCG